MRDGPTMLYFSWPMTESLSRRADADFVALMKAHFERRGAAVAQALLCGALDVVQHRRLLRLVSLELDLAALTLLNASATLQ